MTGESIAYDYIIRDSNIRTTRIQESNHSRSNVDGGYVTLSDVNARDITLRKNHSVLPMAVENVPLEHVGRNSLFRNDIYQPSLSVTDGYKKQKVVELTGFGYDKHFSAPDA